MSSSFGQVLGKFADFAPLSEKSSIHVHEVVDDCNLSWGTFCAKFILKQCQEVYEIARFEFNLVKPCVKTESGNAKMNICKY